MARQRAYLLPDVLCPTETLDICISIPNNLGHILPFLAQIEHLANWYAWERNETRDNATVADCWRVVFEAVRASIDGHLGCGDVSGIQDLRLSDCILEKQDSEGNWTTVGSIADCVTAGIEDALSSGLIPPSPYPAFPSPATNEDNPTVAALSCGIADFMTEYLIDKFNDVLDLIEAGILAGATVAKIAADVVDAVIGFAPVVGGIVGAVKDVIEGSVSVTFAVIRASDTVDWHTDVKCDLYNRLYNNGGTIGTELAPVITGWIAYVKGLSPAISPLFGRFLEGIDIEAFRKWQKIAENNDGECDDCTLSWTHQFDFSTGQHGWYAFNDWADYAGGKWNGISRVESGTTLETLYIALNIPEGADIVGFNVTLTNTDVYQNTNDLFRGHDGENWTGSPTFTFNGAYGNHASITATETGGGVSGGAGTKTLLLSMNGYSGATLECLQITIQGEGTEPTWS